jgi:D-alanyl-D-alanine carboxypeptidase
MGGCLIACAVACYVAGLRPQFRPAPGGGRLPDTPTAILIEGESGSVLFEKSADDLVAPASLSS